jgi:hypothetical protein
MRCNATINLGPFKAVYCSREFGHEGDHERESENVTVSSGESQEQKQAQARRMHEMREGPQAPSRANVPKV